MSVVDGQNANQTSFNNAFVSRTSNTNTSGKVDLQNADAASGASVTNTQREINSLNAYTGRPAGSAHNASPTWTSSEVGTSGDSLKARAEAITVEFDEATGHTHDGTPGNGGPLTVAASGVAGIVSAVAQEFSGDKTFNDGVIVNGLTNLIGELAAQGKVNFGTQNNASSGSNADIGPFTTAFIRLTSGTLVSIRNIEYSGTSAQVLVFTNVTGVSVAFRNMGGGVASEQIVTGTGADLTVANGASIWMIYNPTDALWQVVGGSGGGSGGGFVVNSFSGTTITASSDGFQKWRYTGGGGTVTAIDPGALQDGAILNIMGTSNSGTINFNNNDTAEGWLLNGPWAGHLGAILSLQWDATLDRFTEVSRT